MKINNEKAIKFLLSQMYQSEFQVIDRLSQHPDGINFRQWLEEKKLTEDCRIAELERKAKKWDELDAKIEKCYPTDDDGNDIEEEGGNLLDIGETAAIAFGYM